MNFEIAAGKGCKSMISVGNSWLSVSELLPSKGVFIITDDNISSLYGNDFPPFPVISIPAGENSKRLSVIEKLASELLEMGAGRDSFILAIGGGVVCDLSGFLASVYMRGIRFGFVSTSLLSQVDASVGGKNGVNLGSAKNMLGTFSQPEFVLCDPVMIKTLPEEEYLSGLAEIIKTGAIMDIDLFQSIELNQDLILERDSDILRKLISRSVELKASVVNADEHETGLRRILNFGHTFGHVIETLASLKHGYAIASGMVLAGNISERTGMLPADENRRLRILLEKYRLLQDYYVSESDFINMILKDKKREDESVHFVLLNGIGKSLVRKFKPDQLLILSKPL